MSTSRLDTLVKIGVPILIVVTGLSLLSHIRTLVILSELIDAVSITVVAVTLIGILLFKMRAKPTPPPASPAPGKDPSSN